MGQLYRRSKIKNIEKSPCEPECIHAHIVSALFILGQSFNIHTGDLETMQACKSKLFCLSVSVCQSEISCLGGCSKSSVGLNFSLKVNQVTGILGLMFILSNSASVVPFDKIVCVISEGGFDSYLVCQV